MNSTVSIPELLAPAGSVESLQAAVDNGADAVYFGIAGPDNFNARVRAKNIPREKLRETMAFLHRRGVRGYVTLNTLVHVEELAEIETLLREFVEADVDAILVQDFGVARLARRLCPTLPLHASTQMSLTAREGIELAQTLGIERVVLPRELSLPQIAELRRTTSVELEVFVHGALCISFSGQCYASLTLGGRSANRGRCAQPCRMPYTLLDGRTNQSVSEPKQLLSPCDLAALPLLPKLVATGVQSLKIEGRLKPPEYVAEVTRTYREALDRARAGGVSPRIRSVPTSSDHPGAHTPGSCADAPGSCADAPGSCALSRLELTFSRGFSTGWLEGVDPRRLVPGQVLAHRGSPLGTVIEARRDAVVVKLSDSVRRGDGVLFENEETPEHSQGGRVYEIIQRKESVKEAHAGDRVLLTFANDSLDSWYILPGQAVRKTDDPRLQRELRKSLESRRSSRRIPLTLTVRAVVGEPVRIDVRSGLGAEFRLDGETNLETARKHPLTVDVLKEQFSRLGETLYELADLNAVLQGDPMLPLSVMGQLRREMVQRLDEYVPPPRPVKFGDSLEGLRREDEEVFRRLESSLPKPERPVLHYLFRDEKILEAEKIRRYLADGCRSFYVEPRELAGYASAAATIRGFNAEYVAVVPRILKPGETTILERIAETKPDAVLVRNLAALAFFRDRKIPMIADFSLNVVNDLSLRQLFDWGVERITPGWDLDEEHWKEFFSRVPPSRIERIVGGRIPLFTVEHCLWKANLVAPGKPCGNLCKGQPLKIRDRRGAIHGVRSDLFCRNIVESSETIQLDELPPGLLHLRIENPT